MAMNKATKMEIKRATESYLLVIAAVSDVIRESGTLGAPGGHLYAAVMEIGMPLHQFESMMAQIVSTKLVDKRGDCYHWVGPRIVREEAVGA